MTAARPAATAWVLGLLGTCIAAKAALLAARLADEAAPAFGPWLPIALIHEDVRLVVVFAAFAAGLAAWARARPRLARLLRVVVAVAYAALTFWTAFNIPIARQLSSPPRPFPLGRPGMTAPTTGRAARGDALAELAELREVGLDDEEQPRSPPALIADGRRFDEPQPAREQRSPLQDVTASRSPARWSLMARHAYLPHRRARA